MLNDLIDLLGEFSPRLAMMWAAWMTVGLALNAWHRRAKRSQLTVHHHGPSTRPKSGVSGPKPTSGVRAPAPQQADAFGELETLLDTPTEPTTTSGGYHRRPGEDSPVMSEAAPVLAAPRALP